MGMDPEEVVVAAATTLLLETALPRNSWPPFWPYFCGAALIDATAAANGSKRGAKSITERKIRVEKLSECDCGKMESLRID